MKTLNLSGHRVKLSAKLVDKGVSFPNDKTSKTLHNKFRVSVTTERGRASFVFFDSMIAYQQGKTELSDSDLLDALGCFLMDSCAGADSFEGFCAEFGYDTDSRNAERIYKACVNSRIKAERLFANIYDTANELNELTNQ